MLVYDHRVFQEEYSEENLDSKLRQLVQTKYGGAAVAVIGALDYVRQLYQGHYREHVPAILHPLRVAWLLLELDQYVNSKVCIAALLHSSLHDQLLTPPMIEQRFGVYVSKLVLSVGETFDCKENSSKNREARQEEWQKIMSGSHEIRSLRTCDDLDTVLSWQRLPASSPARSSLPLWLTEVRERALPLAHATNIHAYTLMLQEYEKLLKMKV